MGAMLSDIPWVHEAILLSIEHGDRGDFATAFMCLSEPLRADAGNPVIWTIASRHLIRGKVYDAAVQHASQALHLYYSNDNFCNGTAECHFTSSQSLMILGKYDEAIKHLNVLLQVEPENTGYMNSKGLCLFQQGQWAEAVKAYNQILAVDQNNSKAFLMKGWALMNLEDYSAALVEVEQSIRLNATERALSLKDELLEKV